MLISDWSSDVCSSDLKRPRCAPYVLCDAPRQGDLDGRGNLSEKALAEFVEFFLNVCIDQVAFMAGIMQTERLADRIIAWATEEIRANSLPAKSDIVLRSVLHQGKLTRCAVDELTSQSSISEEHTSELQSLMSISNAV